MARFVQVSGKFLVAVVAVCIVTTSVGADDPTFIGSKKCKMCHSKQYKSWAETKMAKAFDILKPNEHVEAKKAVGLDPAKDYTADAKCVKCHVVGHGMPGGYATPADGDKKAARAAKARMGVGCEMCHGAGSEYAKLHKDILMTSRQYDREEMYAAGMKKITAETCTVCHNAESPTYDPSKPFDYEKRKAEGTHKNFPLKFRKE